MCHYSRKVCPRCLFFTVRIKNCRVERQIVNPALAKCKTKCSDGQASACYGEQQHSFFSLDLNTCTNGLRQHIIIYPLDLLSSSSYPFFLPLAYHTFLQVLKSSGILMYGPAQPFACSVPDYIIRPSSPFFFPFSFNFLPYFLPPFSLQPTPLPI